jgi:cytochrome b561
MATTSAAASSTGYTRTAVALHWTVGGLIVCAFAMGWVMTDLAISPLKLKMYNWHKWLGMSILALVIIRTVWRLTHPAPALLPMPRWQAMAAHGLHGVLYLLMLSIPLSGWAYSNAAGYPIVYLGLIRLPDLVARDKPLAAQLLEVHEVLGWVLIACVAIHVAAALKHHFFDRDATLQRMMRWRAS